MRMFQRLDWAPRGSEQVKSVLPYGVRCGAPLEARNYLWHVNIRYGHLCPMYIWRAVESAQAGP